MQLQHPRLAYSCSGTLFLSFLPPDKPPTSHVLKSYQAISPSAQTYFISTVSGRHGFHITVSELLPPGNSCLKPPFGKLHLPLSSKLMRNHWFLSHFMFKTTLPSELLFFPSSNRVFFFLYIYILMWTSFKAFLLNLLQYCFWFSCLGVLALRPVGS